MQLQVLFDQLVWGILAYIIDEINLALYIVGLVTRIPAS